MFVFLNSQARNRRRQPPDKGDLLFQRQAWNQVGDPLLNGQIGIEVRRTSRRLLRHCLLRSRVTPAGNRE